MAFNSFPAKGGIPSGTTAQRPVSPAIGDTYYDGTLGFLLIWDGTAFIPCSAPAAQPSITVTDVGTGVAYGTVQGSVAFTEGVSGGKAAGFTAIQSSFSTTGTSSPLVVTITGNPGSYAFSGTAYNGFGTSPSALSVSQTLTSVPGAPTSVTPSGATASTVLVSWTAPATGGKAISSYTVTPYIGATAQTTTSTSSTSVTVTGLTSDTYTFKVKATNANGTGVDSAASTSVLVGTIAEVLVIGGGGNGGNVIGAGGGAGGFRTTTALLVSGSSVTVTVGAGRTQDNTTRGRGGQSVFGTFIASGGGDGGYTADQDGTAGGSGGGAPWRDQPTARYGGSGNFGNYSPVEGYAGGNNTQTTTVATNAGGGGGGAGGVGQDANARGDNAGGNGGVGAYSSITGSSIGYAGGGAGSNRNGSNHGAAVNGGGAISTNGTANTGGGGGANGYGSPNTGSGSGGSGVVIIAYPSDAPALTTIPGTLTYSVSTASRSGYRVYTFTAGTGTVTI